MNRLIYTTCFLCLVMVLSSCHTLNQIANTALGGESNGEPSDLEIGNGLKEALNVGITKGVEQLIKQDGYFKNELIKILLPPEAQKVQSVITKYVPGGQKLVDDAVLKMNRAAEDAANEAKPIFVNAIKSLSFKDVKNILFGADNAATDYLKGKTLQSLTAAYSPRINESLTKVGATQAWQALVNPYNKFANSPASAVVKDAKPINPDLGAYVTEKALQGLFFKVQEQEKKIRTDVSSRSSDLLKDVFGLLDKKD